MNVRIGNLTFDHGTYDSRGDVLYLHVGEPRAAADGETTPEGHALRFDDSGNIVGVTIVNAKWLLERDGKLTITLPDRVEIEPDELAEALTTPA